MKELRGTRFDSGEAGEEIPRPYPHRRASLPSSLVSRISFLAALLAALAAAGCARLPPPPPTECDLPEDFPEDVYTAALRRGEPVLRIDPVRSEVLIYAWRGGPLARLGHDHVIAARDVQGYALVNPPPAPLAARADLSVRLDRLRVDEPEARARAGLATQPTEDDIAGTRRNMLEKVLETHRHPFARLHIEASAARGGTEVVLAVELTLHGVTRRLSVPAAVEPHGTGFVVRGEFALRQTDFGITPYSVLGGALKVEDRLDVHFRIHAVRLLPDDNVCARR